MLILTKEQMTSKNQKIVITAEQVSGYCECKGRRCRRCGLCIDWYFDRMKQHWVRRDGSTCHRAHVNPDCHDDLDADTLQAKEICICKN